MSEITLDDYKAMVGQEVGVSRWFEVSQGRIDSFADVSEDHRSSTWKYGELLEKNAQTAATRGVFGAPAFIIGDDQFFGKDRLGFLEERVRG